MKNPLKNIAGSNASGARSLRQLPTRRYFFVMLAISVLLIQTFILIVYQQSRTTQMSGIQLMHSYEALRLAQSSVVDAIDFANDDEYFLLTGQASYKQALADTRKRLDEEMAQLGTYNLSNDSYQSNIAELTTRIRHLESLSASHLDAIAHNRIDAYSLKNFTDQTRLATADMRAAYEQLTHSETEIIQGRRAKVHAERDQYIWTLGVGTMLVLGFLVIGNAIIATLISRNARAAEKLQKSEELFALILNEIQEGVFDQELKQNRITYSPSYKSILGYDEKELGATLDGFRTLMHPDDIPASDQVFARYISGETRTYYNVFRLRHKDGHWVWLMSRGVGIRNEHGDIERLVGTHTDISAQKQREEELNYFMKENELQRRELAAAKEKAETANQAKSDFLATMSHEIRTPMNAVLGLAGLMLKTRLDGRQQQMMETLYANADILLRLVNDLLDLSRIESEQVELETRAFSFDGLLKATQAMFGGQIAAKNLRLTLDNQAGGQVFIGDSARLQQVVVNLVSNAIKFTPQGGITVTVRPQSADGDKTIMAISVEDSGVGIPPDKLAHVFEKFVQADQTISRRFGGSGLGLAICRSLIDLMGGAITVVSAENAGSTFTVTLPLTKPAEKPVDKILSSPDVLAIQQAAPPTESAVPAPSDDLTAGLVLVVEDYAPNVLVATLMLESLGYAADVATCGADALQKLRDCERPYAAILMDVQMQGMNGYETTKAVRAVEQERGFRHIIIGLTAHALAGDREKCLSAGMDDYMSKPINPDILAEKMNRHARAA